MKRDLSRQHRQVIEYLAGKAGGADGKTCWESTAQVAEALGLPMVDVQRAVSHWEGKGQIEVLRQRHGEAWRYGGFRLLKLPGLRAGPAPAAGPPPVNGALPLTPRLDEMLAALELVASVFNGAGATVKLPAVVEEGLALRKWAKAHAR